MTLLLDPAILFFVFGALAGALKSNLEIPQPISRFLSLYLLMALGLKGGFALANSGITTQVAAGLAAAIALAVLIPVAGYMMLRQFVTSFYAAAIAATYGSVSAVTFVTATQFLETHQIPYEGHMAAAMALMESPAIIIAVLLANHLRQSASSTLVIPAGGGTAALGTSPARAGVPLRKILHESFTDGAQLLLLGAMAIGLMTGDAGKAAMQPFSGDLFKGMLSLFLLDMGLMTASNLPQIRGKSAWLIAYAMLAPFAHALLALLIGWLASLPVGDTTLLMVLAASASYIAVPAVLRYAIPEANPSVYFGMSLGVTFPLNILIGIPIYSHVAQGLLG